MIALNLALAGALASLNLLGPPALPPEPADDRAPSPEPDEAPDPAAAPAAPPAPGPAPAEPHTPRARSSLPPGLQTVPFPLEQHRRPNTPPSAHATPRSFGPPRTTQAQPQPLSIIDLRDPFDRPAPRQRTPNQQADAERMLMPDLKDPFAQGVRRVRSTTLERHVPNDIRDPFRPRPRSANPAPACAKTTDDGTVVQAPGTSSGSGSSSGNLPACQQSDLELHDPFTREAAP